MLQKSSIILVTFFLFLLLSKSSSIPKKPALQCKGYMNQNVDWYILYKLPKSTESNQAPASPLIKEGVAYLYMTSDEPYWQLSKNSITAKDSIPGYTLAPLYQDTNSSSLLWFLYNDQPPNKSYSSKYGHAKGVVMTDETQGFWLIHSVPNYPPVPNSGMNKGKIKPPRPSDLPEGSYGYPESGKNYGQSFLCISVKNTQFDDIGQQLRYNQIIVYRYKLPDKLSLKYANLTAAAKQKRIKDGTTTRMTTVTSLSGMPFTSFAKSDKWEKDLYDDFIAPQFKVDLYVESWLNGPDKLPSDCNRTKVMNIKTIWLKNINIWFKSSVDHSKWAVQVLFDQSHPSQWTCIADINRSQTQFSRGGGAVCVNHPNVWKQYIAASYDIEPCPRNKFYHK